MSEFQEWLSEMPELKGIEIPRHYGTSFDDKPDLHVFADASEIAMCVVAYLRFKSMNTTRVKFIIGKTRVSPMKPVSIPRLELQAALYGSRIKQTIEKEHDIKFSEVFMWSDSTTVLQWLRSADQKHPVFIANRVAEILDTTTIDQWRNVPGVTNPADLGTRGLKANEILQSVWLKGPNWLYHDKNEWPLTTSNSTDVSSDKLGSSKEIFQRELVSQPLDGTPEKIINRNNPTTDSGLLGVDVWVSLPNVEFPSETFVESISIDNQNEEISQLIDWRRFSSWSKLVNTICYVMRFLQKSKIKGKLTVDEIEKSEAVIFKLTQKEEFQCDVKELTKNLSVKQNSRLIQLTPFLDSDGILRSQGRLSKSSLEFETKHPIIISAKHWAIKLFLENQHRINYHQGVEFLRNQIQAKYWVLGVRKCL